MCELIPVHPPVCMYSQFLRSLDEFFLFNKFTGTLEIVRRRQLEKVI